MAKMPSIKALVLPTTDSFFLDKWEKTVGILRPKFFGISRVNYFQEFFVLIILEDFGLENHQVDVAYTYRILQPQGQVLGKGKGTVFQGTLSHRQLLLATDIPQISFDSANPSGEYLLSFEIEDRILKKSVNYSLPITVQSFQSVDAVDGEGKLGEWMSAYYLSPRPEELLSAFVLFCETIQEEILFANGICFFRECLNNSLFLGKEFLALYQVNDSPTLKENILCLLANSQYADIAASQLQSDENRGLFQEFAENTLPGLSTLDITHPQELDFLWSAFFATGRYEHVKRVILQISRKEHTGDEKEKIINEAISGAAIWSLSTNCQTHEFVQVYCKYFFQQEQFDSKIKESLGEIIAPYM